VNGAAAPARLTLGLETSTHSGGAALLRLGGGPDNDTDRNVHPTGDLMGSVTFTTKQLYSQRLLPTIEWLLDRTQVQVSDINTIGNSVGPGSFTGLRIGLSVAKALAYASGASIVGVGTLEALAVRAAAGRDALVCPLLDARQGQVYAGLYRVSWSSGLPAVEQVREDWAGPIEEVAGWIEEPTLFAGDALPLAMARLQPELQENFQLPAIHHRLPHPEEVALLAATRAAAGQADNPLLLEPKYVRQTYTQRTKQAP
jgi:tRNA threonylcarbamoyladenosine biosynthesis protein TsaB